MLTRRGKPVGFAQSGVRLDGEPQEGVQERMVTVGGSRRLRTISALVVALVFGTTGVAWATHVTPTFVNSNASCAQLIDEPGIQEFKINAPISDATYNNGAGFSVTLTTHQTSLGQTFDFVASSAVVGVFVKGGPVGFLYEYDPPETSDTGLHPPINPSNGRYYGLSHISFCFLPLPSTTLNLQASTPSTLSVHPGDNVSLTFREANDGDFPLTNVHVTTDSSACNTTLAPASVSLAVDAFQDFTCSFTVPLAQTADITIVAIGHGVDPQGRDVTDCTGLSDTTGLFCDADEREVVSIHVVNPSTTLALQSTTPSPPTVAAGGSVTLVFRETNDGDGTLTNVHVTTDYAPCNATMTPASVTLASLGFQDFTCTFTVPASQTTDITVTATGHGTDELGAEVTFCTTPVGNQICDRQEQTSVTITVVAPGTTLALQSSTPAAPIIVHEGDPVTLVFRETNSGNVQLTNVHISIFQDGSPSTICIPSPGSVTLNPGQFQDFTCSIADVGANDTTITAVGHGLDPLGRDVTDCTGLSDTTGLVCDARERVSVPIDVVHPSTTLALQSSTPAVLTVAPGDQVTLVFRETNDGDTTLTNVHVTTNYALCSPTPTNQTLVSLAFADFSCTFTIPADQPAGTITVTAIGHGTDPLGTEVTFCTAPVGNQICDLQETAQAVITVEIPGEGCTPGYWKTHPESWGPTGFTTSQTVESVFDVPDSFGLDSVTLLQALDLSGGPGPSGAAQTLLRAAVAALLNAAHPDVDYPDSVADVISSTNAALASGNRNTMLSLASDLDTQNNLNCTLS